MANGDSSAWNPMIPPMTRAMEVTLGITRARKLADPEQCPTHREEQVAGDRSEAEKHRWVAVQHLRSRGPVREGGDREGLEPEVSAEQHCADDRSAHGDHPEPAGLASLPCVRAEQCKYECNEADHVDDPAGLEHDALRRSK